MKYNANAKYANSTIRKYKNLMTNIDVNAIIARVKLLRNQFSGNRGKSEFAKLIGISPSTYSYYEKNRLPPIDILLKICEITGTDLEWLLTGETDKENDGYDFNSPLLRNIDKLLSGKPELNEPISAFIELLGQKSGLENQLKTTLSSAQTKRPGWIPVLGRTAAGIVHYWDQTILPDSQQAVTELAQLVEKHIGKTIIESTDGKMSLDLRTRILVDGIKKSDANLIQVAGDEQDEIVQFVQSEEIHKLFPDSFALQIDGDSMSPRIKDSDIVIVSPSVPAAQGQIAIARVADQIGVTCKLIREAGDNIHLIPINEKYETKVVNKTDLLWALAVLCHINV